MPYKGIWQHTRKTKREIEVHKIFSLNGIRRSGDDTSGKMHITGLMRFKNRKFPLLIFASQEERLAGLWH